MFIIFCFKLGKLYDTQHTDNRKGLVVGLITEGQTENQVFDYLEELSFLAETAGIETVETFFQKLNKPDVKTYIKKGKLEEVHQYIQTNAIDVVLFDDELSPSQQRNIQEVLECDVVDRSRLILDIFALRAQTNQAKTQVKLAELQYMLPRLRGMWTHLDRVKGGIGMKGAGEKEIETDKRTAQQKIAQLKKKLVAIESQEQIKRNRRGQLIRVALVGYTNVGKSTIMRLLSKEQVFVENKLFATLDTIVRKVNINRQAFLLSDTVGFIRKLPHHLIESFKSTLAEAIEADILIHVVDMSHPNHEDHIETVLNTLKEVGVKDKPILTVFNKLDAYQSTYFDAYLQEEVKRDILDDLKIKWTEKLGNDFVMLSAHKKINIQAFKEQLHEIVKEQYGIRYPYYSAEY